MKKVTLASILVATLLLFGCQGDDSNLSFTGEGEHWSSTVTVHQTNGDETYKVQINYKGDSTQDIEAFSYNVITKNNDVINYTENSASLNKEGNYLKELPISNSASTTVKDELVINVEWNEMREEILLKNK